MSADGGWPAGETRVSPVGRTITEADNVWASCVTMNASPVHLDAEYMAATEAGRPLVLGVLTAALALGIGAPPIAGATLTGLDRIRLRAPVFVGDTIRSLSRYGHPMGADGDRQSALLHIDGLNQDSIVVVTVDARYDLAVAPGRPR